jgi:hypothetical protein
LLEEFLEFSLLLLLYVFPTDWSSNNFVHRYRIFRCRRRSSLLESIVRCVLASQESDSL